MSKLTEAELIALARLASKVEPETELISKKIIRPRDARVSAFINKFNIKAGRNIVSVDVLHEAFEMWDETGIEEAKFRKTINKIFKSSGYGRVKLNMKPITILELVRESKQHEQQKEQIQTS